MLEIIVNEESVYEYDAGGTLSQQQLDFIDQMDRDMDKGIKIDGELFKSPTIDQRLQFVALNLLRALQQEDYARMQVACAYMTHRRESLSSVIYSRDDEGLVIELVDDANAR